jgi:biopolymer transport protein ExbD
VATLRRGLWVRLAGPIIVVMLAACGDEAPVRIVTLAVQTDGSYVLQGAAIRHDDLTGLLKTLAAQPGAIELRIVADPGARHSWVAGAIAASQEAGIVRTVVAPAQPGK